MTRDDIIRMAREAGWAIYEDMPYMDVQAVQDALIERLERFSVLVAAAQRERIIAQNAPEIEKVNAHIKALETDPALHFCHRFAILMESMLLSNDINLNKYWDEAHALLGEYHKAQEWWQHQMGEPYVSGFGKD